MGAASAQKVKAEWCNVQYAGWLVYRWCDRPVGHDGPHNGHTWDHFTVDYCRTCGEGHALFDGLCWKCRTSLSPAKDA